MKQENLIFTSLTNKKLLTNEHRKALVSEKFCNFAINYKYIIYGYVD